MNPDGLRQPQLMASGLSRFVLPLFAEDSASGTCCDILSPRSPQIRSNPDGGRSNAKDRDSVCQLPAGIELTLCERVSDSKRLW
jgi:hypothetical protein